MYRGNRANRTAQRTCDLQEKKLHVPLVDRTPLEPSPFIVAVVGPPKSGKSTLIRTLVRHYAKQNLHEILGPITVVSGKKRRLTFIECTNDMNSMIDVAKVADLVLLLMNASFGFEMETFEFLNVVQAHGFPKIMGILTHLDTFTSAEKLKDTKKRLKHRFWAEIYQGAKLFYFSGLLHGRYLPRETMNLARFISVMKFRPLIWRNTHGYVLADRMEDLTNPETLRTNPEVDRRVALYGYVRGTGIRSGTRVHIPGVGDVTVAEATALPDPCPLPETNKAKRRTLNEKERLIYAPMSALGGILYDKDAVYIDMPSAAVEKKGDEELGEGDQLLFQLKGMKGSLDASIRQSSVSLFSDITKARIDNLPSDDDEDDDAEAHHGAVDSSDDEDVRRGPVRLEEESQEEEIDDAEHLFTKANDEDVLFEDNDDSYKVAQKWRQTLLGNVNPNSKLPSKVSWMDIVYNESESKSLKDNHMDKSFDGLFFKRAVSGNCVETIDDLPSRPQDDTYNNWSDEEALEGLRDRFITGKIGSDNDSDGMEEEEGDFEDLEEGDEEENEEADEQNAKLAEIEAKKEQLKKKFDLEYDSKTLEKAELDKDKTLFDLKKEEMKEQMLANREAFANLDGELREQLEGVQPGNYCRILISDMPCEFVDFFDPKYHIVVGGLQPMETQFGLVTVRIKKHRWYPQILKNNEPLIVSLGWRRFQTLPLYYLSDANGLRHRLLKYTPKHMHCQAVFYGPITPQNSGFCAFKSITEQSSHFRISATGVTLESDQSVQIVKKLKLTGTPLKINKNTVFVKDMFTSAIEVAKFDGAALRTVSGIRGQIKKAIKSPQGAFRATFEDKLLMSDIIFLRAWYPVTPREFYNPVTSLLLRNKNSWKGMRLNYQIRMDEGLPMVNHKKLDSVKKDVADRPLKRKFNPLKIPQALEKALPFASKPKVHLKRKDTPYLAKRAIIHSDKKDKKIHTLLQQLATIQNAKLEKKRQKNLEHQAKKAKLEARAKSAT